ncbi:MAG TPA: methylmalonyl-CoA epimerase [bacterium]|nr:methylmalonyl-CoA epimerase [bacterium]
MILDHVGVAVWELSTAVELYAHTFGAAVSERYDLPDDHVRVAFLDAGGALIELLQPLGEQGPVFRFLQRRGEGLHHLAFLVPDIARALEQARAAGQRLIDEHPRSGAGGRLVAFVHPAAARGVLIELVQAPQAR